MSSFINVLQGLHLQAKREKMKLPLLPIGMEGEAMNPSAIRNLKAYCPVNCFNCNGDRYNTVGSSYLDICVFCSGTGRDPLPWSEIVNRQSTTSLHRIVTQLKEDRK